MMPFEIVDRRGATASAHFFKDICFPPEREVGFWKPKAIHDNYVELSTGEALFCKPVSCNKGVEPTEKIEAETIRNLLPDEDDLFSGVTEELEYATRANGADVVDDLDIFSNGGGMELEGDNCSHPGQQKNSNFAGGNSISQGSSNGGLFASEHPYGEHPSRTLFIRNISSSVEDFELRALFEQYGDIRTLYTACKHRGFVMISYYDIRAARNAMRALQNKPLRRRKLDIHFSIPKDNPPEKDINQGALVVFNLDTSVSNGDLRHIFGIYGEIKEIRETPHEHHHKFIEFYDVRAAEAALRALNGRDIAGKRIKLEPSRPGGARQCLTEHCSELLYEPSPFRNPNDSSSLELMSMVSPGGTTRFMDNKSIQGLHSAIRVPSSALTEDANHHESSSVLSSLPSPVRVVSAGNHFGLCECSHSTDKVKFGNECIPSSHPHSFPVYHDSFNNAFQYNSSSNFLDMAGNIGVSVGDRMTDKHTCKVGSNGQLKELNGRVFGSSKSGTCPLLGHCNVWNNFNSFQHHPLSSMSWSNSPLFVNGLHASRPAQLPGFSGEPSHILNTNLPAHHVGSAPAKYPDLWDGWHTYTGGSPEASEFQLGSLGNVSFPGSLPLQPLERSHNIFSHIGENCTDMLKNDVMRCPNQMSHIFSGRNAVTSMATSFGSPSERVRNPSYRGNGGSSIHADKKQFELEIDRILHGEDSRTTLMIKNIPNKYTSKMILAAIDEQCRGTYDFIYLPIDFKNKCNVGYAFINLIDPLHIIPFHKAFNGKKWEKFNSEKVASLAYARIQGKTALIAHFQNSSLMNEDKRCRPILFCTDGPNAGDQEPFPVGSNIRQRPNKSRGLVDEENHHQGSSLSSVNEEESSKGTDSSSGSSKDSD
ncbi:protein MEI2-like 4 isoform X2 [Cornus florida]|uniref:protein MEI2-like 4 isoform X2 n=1 Tax=Cornus florida TaxID=4283 RepID=UPI00289ED720|nr:protein MEI2-like 4 isoform X2 [Cornus florida]